MIHTPVGADRSSPRNWSAPTVTHATMSPCRATPARAAGPAGGADGSAQHPGPGCAAARPDASRAVPRPVDRADRVSGSSRARARSGVLLWAGTSWTASLWIAGHGRRDRPGRGVVGVDGPRSGVTPLTRVGGPVCSRSTTLTTPEHHDRERHGRHDVGEEVVAEVQPAQRDQGGADDGRDAPRHDPRHRRVPAAHQVAGDEQERRDPDGVTRRERRRRLGAGHEHRVLGRPLASHQTLDREADQGRRDHRPRQEQRPPPLATHQAPDQARDPDDDRQDRRPGHERDGRQHGGPPGSSGARRASRGPAGPGPTGRPSPARRRAPTKNTPSPTTTSTRPGRTAQSTGRARSAANADVLGGARPGSSDMHRR